MSSRGSLELENSYTSPESVEALGLDRHQEHDDRTRKKQKVSRSKTACLQVSVIPLAHSRLTTRSVEVEDRDAVLCLLELVPHASHMVWSVNGQSKVAVAVEADLAQIIEAEMISP
jgi:hypothetical protein